MTYFFGIFALVIGIAGGLAFPDLDLKLNFLVHRSAITHSLFLPILLFGLAYIKKHTVTRLLAIGTSLSIAIHLCFDLFPKEWMGFALITLPVFGRTNPIFSWIWIAANILGCVYLSFILIDHAFDLVLLLSSTLVTFGMYALQENVFWSALIALVITIGVVMILPSAGNTKLKQLGRARDF
jgi:hypothetical protein